MEVDTYLLLSTFIYLVDDFDLPILEFILHTREKTIKWKKWGFISGIYGVF